MLKTGATDEGKDMIRDTVSKTKEELFKLELLLEDKTIELEEQLTKLAESLDQIESDTYYL